MSVLLSGASGFFPSKEAPQGTVASIFLIGVDRRHFFRDARDAWRLRSVTMSVTASLPRWLGISASSVTV